MIDAKAAEETAPTKETVAAAVEVTTETKPVSRVTSPTLEQQNDLLSTSVLSRRRPSKYTIARRTNRSTSNRSSFSPQPNFNETQLFSMASINMSHTMSFRDF